MIDEEMMELKMDALKMILAYIDGDPDISREMCRTAANILIVCIKE